MKISVLASGHSFLHRSLYFPLLAFRRELAERTLRMRLFFAPREEMLDCDLLVLASRFFRQWQNTRTRNRKNEEELLAFLERARRGAGRIAWFDESDPAGSCDFAVIGRVDFFWKKQLFKDRGLYLRDDPAVVRPWLDHRGLPEMAFPYRPCPEADLPKLRVAWNIGLMDYRALPGPLAPFANWLPRYALRRRPDWPRKAVDLHFRGRAPESAIGAQRRLFLGRCAALREKTGIIMAGPGLVGRRRYLKELRRSRMVLSPFGWGEICFRDFEAFAASALLLKPDLGHLETFPDVFVPGETYAPLRWDGGDLEERLRFFLQAPERAREIAEAGYDSFARQVLATDRFVEHFSRLVRNGPSGSGGG
ncbi:MAG: glycosyltransferase family 1 protein [Candidatus Aminicenantes bacterium]|nr:glycosyltransferase family 1 protein [Candidatus Aminicenantes bacterium]